MWIFHVTLLCQLTSTDACSANASVIIAPSTEPNKLLKCKSAGYTTHLKNQLHLGWRIFSFPYLLERSSPKVWGLVTGWCLGYCYMPGTWALAKYNPFFIQAVLQAWGLIEWELLASIVLCSFGCCRNILRSAHFCMWCVLLQACWTCARASF